MIIGISGKIGSGKDLVGNIIRTLIWLKDPKNKLRVPIEEFVQTNGIFTPEGVRGFINAYKDSGWELKKFADRLKDTVCLLLNCTRTELEDREFKEKELGEEWSCWKYDDYGNIYPKPSLNTPNWPPLLSVEKIPNMIGGYKETLTPRKILQLLGTEAGREIIHPNIWCNALFSDYKPNINPREQLNHKENWFKKRGYDFEELKISNRDLYFSLKEEYFSELTKLLPNWIITDVRFENEANFIKNRAGILIRVNRKEYEDTGKHLSETGLDDYQSWNYVIDNNSDITTLIEIVKEILIKENLL